MLIGGADLKRFLRGFGVLVCLLSLCVTVATASSMELSYYAVLEDVVGEHGIFKGELSSSTTLKTGLLFADLVDFDNDGSEELLFSYVGWVTSTYYGLVTEVWSYDTVATLELKEYYLLNQRNVTLPKKPLSLIYREDGTVLLWQNADVVIDDLPLAINRYFEFTEDGFLVHHAEEIYESWEDLSEDWVYTEDGWQFSMLYSSLNFNPATEEDSAIEEEEDSTTEEEDEDLTTEEEDSEVGDDSEDDEDSDDEIEEEAEENASSEGDLSSVTQTFVTEEYDLSNPLPWDTLRTYEDLEGKQLALLGVYELVDFLYFDGESWKYSVDLYYDYQEIAFDSYTLEEIRRRLPYLGDLSQIGLTTAHASAMAKLLEDTLHSIALDEIYYDKLENNDTLLAGLIGGEPPFLVMGLDVFGWDGLALSPFGTTFSAVNLMDGEVYGHRMVGEGDSSYYLSYRLDDTSSELPSRLSYQRFETPFTVGEYETSVTSGKLDFYKDLYQWMVETCAPLGISITPDHMNQLTFEGIATNGRATTLTSVTQAMSSTATNVIGVMLVVDHELTTDVKQKSTLSLENGIEMSSEPFVSGGSMELRELSNLLRSFAEKSHIQYTFPLLPENQATLMMDQLGIYGGLVSSYLVEDGVYYIITESQGSEMGYLILDAPESTPPYTISKQSTFLFYQSDLEFEAMQYRESFAITPHYFDIVNFTTEDQYFDYFISLFPENGISDSEKMILTPFLEQSITNYATTVISGSGDFAEITAKIVEDLVGRGSSLSQKFTTFFSNHSHSMLADHQERIRIVLDGYDEENWTVFIPKSVRNLLRDYELQIFCGDTGVSLTSDLLSPLLGEYSGGVYLTVRTSEHGIYDIWLEDHENNKIPDLPSRLEVYFPSSSPYDAVFLDGINLGGQYDELGNTLSFFTHRSGSFVVADNHTLIVDLGVDERPIIESLVARGFFETDSLGYFSPDGEVSRQELAEILATMLGLSSDGSSPLLDVEAEQSIAVASVSQRGWMNGFTGNLFYGEISVTEEMFYAILSDLLVRERGYRYPSDSTPYLESIEGGYRTGEWAEDGMALAVAVGLVSDAVSPTTAISRVDCALALARLYELLEPPARISLTGASLVEIIPPDYVQILVILSSVILGTVVLIAMRVKGNPQLKKRKSSC